MEELNIAKGQLNFRSWGWGWGWGWGLFAQVTCWMYCKYQLIGILSMVFQWRWPNAKIIVFEHEE